MAHGGNSTRKSIHHEKGTSLRRAKRRCHGWCFQRGKNRNNRIAAAGKIKQPRCQPAAIGRAAHIKLPMFHTMRAAKVLRSAAPAR
jgi:hypothetical protein